MPITFTAPPGAAITIAGQVIPSYAAGPSPVLLGTDPADNASGVSATAPWVATFDQNVQFGAGSIVFQELYDGSGGWQPVEVFDVTTDVGSGAGQVEIVGGQLFIRTTAAKVPGREYGVRIDGGAIENLGGVAWGGINNNSAWTAWIAEVAGGESLAVAPTYDGLALDPITPADLPYDFAQHISATPPPAYSITGQPAGVSINSATGAITDDGTPFTGSASATAAADNGIAPNADADLAFAQS